MYLHRGALGCFVQAMSESSHHAQHTNVSRGCEHYVEKNFSFNAHLSRFGGVNRPRFRKDLYGRGIRGAHGAFRRCLSSGGIAKSAGAYTSSRIPIT